MELLLELFQINDQVEQELFEGQLMTVLEDLGNLKQLNIGPMINAFKQSYNNYDNGRRGGRSLSQTHVGNKLSRQWMQSIGRDSEVIEDTTAIKNWNGVRRVIDKQEGRVVGAVINLNKKPIAVMVTPSTELQYKDTAVGLAWDFTRGGVLKDEEKEALSAVLAKAASDYKQDVVGSSKDKSEANSVEWERFYDSDKVGELIKAGKPPRTGERKVAVKDYETWYDAMKDGGAKVDRSDKLVTAEYKGMPAGEWDKEAGKGFIIQRGDPFNKNIEKVYGKVKQLQGIAQRVENVKMFINELVKYGPVTLTVILGDKKADETRNARSKRGGPASRILSNEEIRQEKKILRNAWQFSKLVSLKPSKMLLRS